MDIFDVYDRLCSALTDYESDDNEQEYDQGYALYKDILSIVNDLAMKLN